MTSDIIYDNSNILLQCAKSQGLRFHHGDGFSTAGVSDDGPISDGKLDGILLGSTGAYCQLCLLSKEQAHSVTRISEVTF